MNNKGRITTRIALIGAVFYIALLILVFLKTITMQEFVLGMTTITATIGVFIGLYSKDSNASHTFSSTSGMPDPTKEEK